MATPLKIKDASGNIQQFTTAEENYIAYQIGLQLADAGTDSAGAIRTGSGTSIGSFTNTFFNQPVGTHPSTAITTGTTTTTIYQNQDSTNVAETDSDWLRPLMWIDSASQTGFKEMPDADLNSAVDRYLQTIFTNNYPGTFKLADTSPGPDYSVHLSSVFTDTRTDGTSVAYNVYKRTSYTAPSTVSPLYVRDNGGFDGIQAMTDRQIKFTFGQRAKRRIAKSKIGTYQLRNSTQGAPTDPGTWVSVGTATDTKQQTSDDVYTRDSTVNFVGNYTQNYTSAYSTNYTRLYSIQYTYPYDTTYTTPYVISYEGSNEKFFGTPYSTSFDLQYSSIFTTTHQAAYDARLYLNPLYTPTVTYATYSKDLAYDASVVETSETRTFGAAGTYVGALIGTKYEGRTADEYAVSLYTSADKSYDEYLSSNNFADYASGTDYLSNIQYSRPGLGYDTAYTGGFVNYTSEYSGTQGTYTGENPLYLSDGSLLVTYYLGDTQYLSVATYLTASGFQQYTEPTQYYDLDYQGPGTLAYADGSYENIYTGPNINGGTTPYVSFYVGTANTNYTGPSNYVRNFYLANVIYSGQKTYTGNTLNYAGPGNYLSNAYVADTDYNLGQYANEYGQFIRNYAGGFYIGVNQGYQSDTLTANYLGGYYYTGSTGPGTGYTGMSAPDDHGYGNSYLAPLAEYYESTSYASYTIDYIGSGVQNYIVSYIGDTYSADNVYSNAYSRYSGSPGQSEYIQVPDLVAYVPTYVQGTDEIGYTELYTGNYTREYTPQYNLSYTSGYTGLTSYGSLPAYDISYVLATTYTSLQYERQEEVFTKAFLDTTLSSLIYVNATSYTRSITATDYQITIPAYEGAGTINYLAGDELSPTGQFATESSYVNQYLLSDGTTEGYLNVIEPYSTIYSKNDYVGGYAGDRNYTSNLYTVITGYFAINLNYTTLVYSDPTNTIQYTGSPSIYQSSPGDYAASNDYTGPDTIYSAPQPIYSSTYTADIPSNYTRNYTGPGYYVGEASYDTSYITHGPLYTNWRDGTVFNTEIGNVNATFFTRALIYLGPVKNYVPDQNIFNAEIYNARSLEGYLQDYFQNHQPGQYYLGNDNIGMEDLQYVGGQNLIYITSYSAAALYAGPGETFYAQNTYYQGISSPTSYAGNYVRTIGFYSGSGRNTTYLGNYTGGGGVPTIYTGFVNYVGPAPTPINYSTAAQYTHSYDNAVSFYTNYGFPTTTETYTREGYTPGNINEPIYNRFGKSYSGYLAGGYISQENPYDLLSPVRIYGADAVASYNIVYTGPGPGFTSITSFQDSYTVASQYSVDLSENDYIPGTDTTVYYTSDTVITLNYDKFNSYTSLQEQYERLFADQYNSALDGLILQGYAGSAFQGFASILSFYAGAYFQKVLPYTGPSGPTYQNEYANAPYTGSYLSGTYVPNTYTGGNTPSGELIYAGVTLQYLGATKSFQQLNDGTAFYLGPEQFFLGPLSTSYVGSTGIFADTFYDQTQARREVYTGSYIGPARAVSYVGTEQFYVGNYEGASGTYLGEYTTGIGYLITEPSPTFETRFSDPINQLSYTGIATEYQATEFVRYIPGANPLNDYVIGYALNTYTGTTNVLSNAYMNVDDYSLGIPIAGTNYTGTSTAVSYETFQSNMNQYTGSQNYVIYHDLYIGPAYISPNATFALAFAPESYQKTYDDAYITNSYTGITTPGVGNVYEQGGYETFYVGDENIYVHGVYSSLDARYYLGVGTSLNYLEGHVQYISGSAFVTYQGSESVYEGNNDIAYLGTSNQIFMSYMGPGTVELAYVDLSYLSTQYFTGDLSYYVSSSGGYDGFTVVPSETDQNRYSQEATTAYLSVGTVGYNNEFNTAGVYVQSNYVPDSLVLGSYISEYVPYLQGYQSATGFTGYGSQDYIDPSQLSPESQINAYEQYRGYTGTALYSPSYLANQETTFIGSPITYVAEDALYIRTDGLAYDGGASGIVSYDNQYASFQNAAATSSYSLSITYDNDSLYERIAAGYLGPGPAGTSNYLSANLFYDGPADDVYINPRIYSSSQIRYGNYTGIITYLGPQTLTYLGPSGYDGYQVNYTTEFASPYLGVTTYYTGYANSYYDRDAFYIADGGASDVYYELVNPDTLNYLGFKFYTSLSLGYISLTGNYGGYLGPAAYVVESGLYNRGASSVNYVGESIAIYNSSSGDYIVPLGSEYYTLNVGDGFYQGSYTGTTFYDRDAPNYYTSGYTTNLQYAGYTATELNEYVGGNTLVATTGYDTDVSFQGKNEFVGIYTGNIYQSETGYTRTERYERTITYTGSFSTTFLGPNVHNMIIPSYTGVVTYVTSSGTVVPGFAEYIPSNYGLAVYSNLDINYTQTYTGGILYTEPVTYGSNPYSENYTGSIYTSIYTDQTYTVNYTGINIDQSYSPTAYSRTYGTYTGDIYVRNPDDVYIGGHYTSSYVEGYIKQYAGNYSTNYSGAELAYTSRYTPSQEFTIVYELFFPTYVGIGTEQQFAGTAETGYTGAGYTGRPYQKVYAGTVAYNTDAFEGGYTTFTRYAHRYTGPGTTAYAGLGRYTRPDDIYYVGPASTYDAYISDAQFKLANYQSFGVATFLNAIGVNYTGPNFYNTNFGTIIQTTYENKVYAGYGNQYTRSYSYFISYINENSPYQELVVYTPNYLTQAEGYSNFAEYNTLYYDAANYTSNYNNFVSKYVNTAAFYATYEVYRGEYTGTSTDYEGPFDYIGMSTYNTYIKDAFTNYYTGIAIVGTANYTAFYTGPSTNYQGLSDYTANSYEKLYLNNDDQNFSGYLGLAPNQFSSGEYLGQGLYPPTYMGGPYTRTLTGYESTEKYTSVITTDSYDVTYVLGGNYTSDYNNYVAGQYYNGFASSGVYENESSGNYTSLQTIEVLYNNYGEGVRTYYVQNSYENSYDFFERAYDSYVVAQYAAPREDLYYVNENLPNVVNYTVTGPYASGSPTSSYQNPNASVQYSAVAETYGSYTPDVLSPQTYIHTVFQQDKDRNIFNNNIYIVSNFYTPSGDELYDSSPFNTPYTGNIVNQYTGGFTANYINQYTGFFAGVYSTLYNIDYIGEYSISYIADYVTDYVTDYTAEYSTTFDAIYQQDYLGNFAGDFAGETIQATSETNETYTLYVRIA